MNAIVVNSFGGPQVLQYCNVEIPLPGPQQCLIRLKACGVNPVDTYIRAGSIPKLPSLPYIPGKDGSGEVIVVGSGVFNFKVGDRVFIFNSSTGTYAENCIVDESNIFKLPDSTTYEEGACLGTPAFTAYRALFHKAKATQDDLVFVHGASGGVGIMVIQMARAYGIKVIGTAGTSEGIESILRAGAEYAFNHCEIDYMNQITKTFPDGIDVCIEMLASSNLDADFNIMKPEGRIIIVGSRGPIQINPRGIMAKELNISGVALLSASAIELREMGNFVTSSLIKNDIKPIIGLTLPLEMANEAHIEVIAKKSLNVGNVVLIP